MLRRISHQERLIANKPVYSSQGKEPYGMLEHASGLRERLSDRQFVQKGLYKCSKLIRIAVFFMTVSTTDHTNCIYYNQNDSFAVVNELVYREGCKPLRLKQAL